MGLVPEVGKRKLKGRLVLISIGLFLWLGVFLHLFPVYWMVTASLKDTVEMFRLPPTLYPHRPNFYIYKVLFQIFSPLKTAAKQASGVGAWGDPHQWDWLRFPFYVYIKNSLILTFGTMILQVPICALAAYTISKLMSAKWSRITFLYIIATMFVPASMLIIPTFLILQNFPFFSRNIPQIPFTGITFPHLNLINTYWAIIFPAVASGFSVLLFKGFFDTIPDELINAARLDGASEIGIFRRIVLPVSKPVFAVVFWYSFTSSWNKFLWPLIVLKTDAKWPLAVLLYEFQNLLTQDPYIDPKTYGEHFVAGYPLLMAMTTMESIPLIIVFIIFREQLMKGIRLRGFK